MYRLGFRWLRILLLKKSLTCQLNIIIVRWLWQHWCSLPQMHLQYKKITLRRFSSGDWGPPSIAKHACCNTGKAENAVVGTCTSFSEVSIMVFSLSTDSSKSKYATSRSYILYRTNEQHKLFSDHEIDLLHQEILYRYWDHPLKGHLHHSKS